MSEQEETLRQIVLRVVQHCLQCQQPFEIGNILMLGQMGKTWFFSLHCPQCHTLAVIGLAMNESQELDLEEVEHLTRLPPISMDEMLDLHLFLKQFNGDFRGLFGEKFQDGP